MSLKKKLKFEYYYKDNECRARTAQDSNCICWHNEGAGPLKEQRHSDETPLVEWRIKGDHEPKLVVDNERQKT